MTSSTSSSTACEADGIALVESVDKNIMMQPLRRPQFVDARAAERTKAALLSFKAHISFLNSRDQG